MTEYISIADLIKVLKRNKIRLVYVALIGAFIGLLIGLLSPKEYKSTVLVLPSVAEEDQVGGSLASLAGLAGISLNSTSSYSLGSEMYPRILSSAPFTLELLKAKFYLEEEGKELSLFEYFQGHLEVGVFGKLMTIPRYVIGLFKDDVSTSAPHISSDGFVILTEDQEKMVEELKSRILIEIDPSVGVVQLSVEMQDPKLAASVTSFTLDYLNNYIINFKTGKLKENLDFLNNQASEAEVKYHNAQKKLAQFKDSNLSLFSASSMIEEKILSNELNRTFEIFDFLSKEREKLMIEIQEQTSAFQIIDPIDIPADETSPKKIVLIISIALILSIAYSFYIILKELAK